MNRPVESGVGGWLWTSGGIAVLGLIGCIATGEIGPGNGSSPGAPGTFFALLTVCGIVALPGVAAAAFASRLRGSKCPIACSVAGFALGALVGVMLASVAFALWSDGRGPGTDLPASTIVAVAFLAGVPLGGIPGAALGWSVGTWLAEQPALRPRRGKDDR